MSSPTGGTLLEILTLEDLTLALKNTLGKKGMSDENIESLANYLLNFFGFNDYVIDNALNSKDRDVFYMLEEEGLLSTTRDEITIQKGKIWRIHYWVLKKDKILKLAREGPPPDREDETDSVYSNLSDDAWRRTED